MATGYMAHVALLAWLLALAILPLFALAGLALYARHRGRLLEVDRPPRRDREAVHRIYDVRSLEARRGWLPESFTYAPHHRNDPEVDVEEPAAALPPPTLTAEAMIAMPELIYGERLDTGAPLVDHSVRSLLVGGVQGSGKSVFVSLLAAQLHRMGARISIGDPHRSNPESLTARLEPLVGHVEVEEQPRMIEQQVAAAYSELQRRKALGEAGDTRPYVVVVDQFPELIRLLGDRDVERLRVALEVIAVFRMRRDEAFQMTGLRAEYWPTDTLLLEPGEGYVCGLTSGAVRVRVPALPAPGSLMVPASFQGPSRPPLRGAVEPNGNHDGTMPPELPEDAVRKLLAKHGDIGKVITELTEKHELCPWKKLIAVEDWREEAAGR